jgi:Tfp pilus assembly protein PilF
MDAIAHARSLIADIRQHPDRFVDNLAEAERALQSAAQAEPSNTDVLTCFGAVLSDMGKHQEAVQVLRSAISAGSRDRNTYFNLGVALINSATHKEAMSYFKQANMLNSSEQTWEAYFDPQAH